MKRDAIHTSLPYPSPWLVKVQPSLSFDAHLMVVQCFVHEALKQLSKMIVKKTKTCFHVRLHRLFIDTGYFFMHCWGWCECSFGDRLRSSVNQKKLGVELHWENPVKEGSGISGETFWACPSRRRQRERPKGHRRDCDSLKAWERLDSQKVSIEENIWVSLVRLLPLQASSG